MDGENPKWAAIWEVIRTRLEERKIRVHQEIRRYPPPIPACDVQFNHLIEERDAVAGELRRLNSIAREPGSSDGLQGAVEAFLQSSPFFSDEVPEILEAGRKT